MDALSPDLRREEDDDDSGVGEVDPPPRDDLCLPDGPDREGFAAG